MYELVVNCRHICDINYGNTLDVIVDDHAIKKHKSTVCRELYSILKHVLHESFDDDRHLLIHADTGVYAYAFAICVYALLVENTEYAGLRFSFIVQSRNHFKSIKRLIRESVCGCTDDRRKKIINELFNSIVYDPRDLLHKVDVAINQDSVEIELPYELDKK